MSHIERLNQLGFRALSALTDLLKKEITPAALATAKEATRETYVQMLVVEAEMFIADGKLVDAMSNLHVISQLAPDNVRWRVLLESIQLKIRASRGSSARCLACTPNSSPAP